MKDKCDVRGAGESFHVEYEACEDMDSREVANLTFRNSIDSDAIAERENLEIMFAASATEDGMVGLHYTPGYDDDMEYHVISVQTARQLADMYRCAADAAELVANRLRAKQAADAQELLDIQASQGILGDIVNPPHARPEPLEVIEGGEQ